ncbi:MAG TPA: DUF4118 domain-containing protein, partial [Thermoanaerobaculia bacterium]
MRREGNPVLRYGFAVLAVGAALGLRLALHPVLRGEAPLLPFVIAVLLASSLGGWGPGLLATVLSAILADYFFLSPRGELGLPSTGGLVQLALFLGIGLTVTLLNRRLRTGAERLGRSEESFRLLVEGVEDYVIFMLDPEGRVVSWNRGAERTKGYRP